MTLSSEIALSLRYFLQNLLVSGAHCVKVVDNAITMDNLRSLCLVVNGCRGNARLPQYKYAITERWFNTCLHKWLLTQKVFIRRKI